MMIKRNLPIQPGVRSLKIFSIMVLYPVPQRFLPIVPARRTTAQFPRRLITLGWIEKSNSPGLADLTILQELLACISGWSSEEGRVKPKRRDHDGPNRIAGFVNPAKQIMTGFILCATGLDCGLPGWITICWVGIRYAGLDCGVLGWIGKSNPCSIYKISLTSSIGIIQGSSVK